MLALANVAQHLGADQPFYGLQPPTDEPVVTRRYESICENVASTWMARVVALGHGQRRTMRAEDALDIAQALQPRTLSIDGTAPAETLTQYSRAAALVLTLSLLAARQTRAA